MLTENHFSKCYKYPKCKQNEWLKMSLATQINSQSKVILNVTPQMIEILKLPSKVKQFLSMLHELKLDT